MITETMLVHEAMANLKILDARIASMNYNTYFHANRANNSKIEGKEIPEVITSIQENHQSMMDMLRRRAAMKQALSLSNAATHVVIGGREYTVAEAIEMKRSGVQLKKAYLEILRRQLTAAKMTCNKNNDVLESKADTYVANIVGTKEQAGAKTFNDVREAYIKANTYEIVTAPDMEKVINQLALEIDTFEAEVDSKLSISNAVTTITFSY